ncbi:hypothetical protein [Nocardiopsis suaedae]|uniref:Uncharacterized protein n=1 Tax=Nocardiopsis suaedae TaxID=3018444 RepID=A0ABT4TPQ5_9ACTN|nr:hypothetical protein [Nocardiopsis suaedae]MDA2806626.1 hypothetical protein [Nocardiopsis suaedae]
MHDSPSLSAERTTHLLERTGDLKGELLDFAMGAEHGEELAERLSEAEHEYGALDEAGRALIIEAFLREEGSDGGAAILERFAAERRPRLDTADREMVLGWMDIVHGVFEVQGRDGEGIRLHNLIDDLVYTVYSTMGGKVFDSLEEGWFATASLVPLWPGSGAWTVAGYMAPRRPEDGPALARAAVEMVTRSPMLALRNPRLVERAWELEAEDRAYFISRHGGDLVIVSGEQVKEELLVFARRENERADAEATAGRDEGPADAVPFDDVPRHGEFPEGEGIALIYDERDGLYYVAGFGLVDELFANPELAADPLRLEDLREYLDDDSVPPSAIRRLVQRHPDTADQVFTAFLGEPEFRWERDGEELLRRWKSSDYEREPVPGITVLGDRLTELAKRAG